MDGDAGPIEAAVTEAAAACLWCDAEFAPRRSGSPQRFCEAKCRSAFHNAGRRWAERCLWCGDEFEPRRGGSPQRFCPPKYRDALYLARRRWAGRTVISGHLTVAELWGDPLEACMLRAGRERHAEDRRRASRRAVIEELALGTAQLASARPMVLEIPITAEGVLELCALRRVDPERLRDPVAAADAVVQLTNAAISLDLASTGLTR